MHFYSLHLQLLMRHFFFFFFYQKALTCLISLNKHNLCVLIWSIFPKPIFVVNLEEYLSGPSCSKLTMSLVNDSLKFTSSDTQIFWNFLLKNVSSFCSAKATHIFSAKNIRILYIESAKTVNEMTLNELVKLMMLWTTGPWKWSHKILINQTKRKWIICNSILCTFICTFP